MKTKKTSSNSKPKQPKHPKPPVSSQIHSWANDPYAQNTPSNPPVLATPLSRPVPDLGSAPLAIGINGTQPQPKLYNIGTSEFRFWTAAEALGRGRDFWRATLPKGTNWYKTVGAKLLVNLDNGLDLNAYYDRKNLDFFHGAAGAMTVYSGESPDVVCHELGHATLDALRPQLFNAGFIETAAFHESFGDMSALLSAVQLREMRVAVLAETHGHVSRTSSWSRLAEQLGYAIRLVQPSAVETDCLRNGVNSLFYRDPSTIPPSAPAGSLSSEPHSFSRVFTGAFLDSIAGVLNVESNGQTPTEAQLLDSANKVAGYLVQAISTASVVPTYYSQVAAAMIHVAQGADAQAISSAFVKHGILSVPAAVSAITGSASIVASAAPTTRPVDLEDVSLDGAHYGLIDETLLLSAIPESPRFHVSTAQLGAVAAVAAAPDQAAKDFVEDLFQLGRIEIGESAAPPAALSFFRTASYRLKTHRIVRDGKALRLCRIRFDCGFHCC